MDKKDSRPSHDHLPYTDGHLADDQSASATVIHVLSKQLGAWNLRPLVDYLCTVRLYYARWSYILHTFHHPLLSAWDSNL